MDCSPGAIPRAVFEPSSLMATGHLRTKGDAGEWNSFIMGAIAASG